MSKITREDALNYHSSGRPGKIEVIPTKPHSTQLDLSLAYSPGVAEPCLAIKDDPEDAYKYTAKGNLVAVMSNGTAVLGLGDIGAVQGKPVMEGKGLLFKIFADVDVFDIEIDRKDVEGFVEVAKAIAPTFGVGLSLYLAEFLSMPIEWRALPFSWNTSGTDESGHERGDFPDDYVNSDDRLFHFNHMVSVGFAFYLPTSPRLTHQDE